MKKNITRIFSLATVTVMTAGMMSVNASAFDINKDMYAVEIEYNQNNNFDMEWNIRTTDSRENVIYIDREQLEKGDYTVNASIFIKSEQELPKYLSTISAAWDSYDENGGIAGLIRLRNLTTGNTSNPMTEVFENIPGLIGDGVVDGTDDVYFKYVASCVSTVVEHGGHKYVKSPMTSFDSQYLVSPDGKTVYSAGPYKIKFQDSETNEWLTYDLEYDKKTGLAKTTEPFYISGKLWTIPHYDPDIPEGEKMPSSCLNTWMYNMNMFGDMAWFGGKSDAYPLVSFDVSVDSDIEDGVYYVAFNNNSGFPNEMSFHDESCLDIENQKIICGHTNHPYTYAENLMVTDEENRLNNKENWLKIVVGSGNEESEGQAYDVNGDGKIDVSDATEELRLYAEAAVNADAQIYKSADGRTHSIANATAMLRHYAESAAGLR